MKKIALALGLVFLMAAGATAADTTDKIEMLDSGWKVVHTIPGVSETNFTVYNGTVKVYFKKCVPAGTHYDVMGIGTQEISLSEDGTTWKISLDYSVLASDTGFLWDGINNGLCQ